MPTVDPRPARHGDGIGSNSWVVSGDHTATGKPLLANDPHLARSMPGIWYQMGLHCRTVDAACPFDVTGFTFSGLPGVVIGHNRDIAWGFTNLDPDVTDLLPGEGHRQHLPVRRQAAAADRARRDHQGRRASRRGAITVRATRHGPAALRRLAELSSVGANAEVPSDSPDRGQRVRRRARVDGADPATHRRRALRARPRADWTAFREAARLFAVPSQNLVYADTAGNIGYQAPGRDPDPEERRTATTRLPGWLPQYDWSGRTCRSTSCPACSTRPRASSSPPTRRSPAPDYRYYLTDSFDHGYRSQRIRDLLTAADRRRLKRSTSPTCAIQLDTRNAIAPVLVPYLMRQLMTSEYYADGPAVLLELGLHASRPTRRPRRTSTRSGATCSRLTFHDQLPRVAVARRRRALVRGGEQPAAPADSQWWDDAAHRRAWSRTATTSWPRRCATPATS